MKKVIGILGVAVFALAMFMNTNSINGSSNMNLATLLGISDANAECLSVQEFQNDGVCDMFNECHTGTYGDYASGRLSCNVYQSFLASN